jgi:hypothetical protein
MRMIKIEKSTESGGGGRDGKGGREIVSDKIPHIFSNPGNNLLAHNRILKNEFCKVFNSNIKNSTKQFSSQHDPSILT